MSILKDYRFERGFGTFPLNGQVLEDAMSAAIDAGYRAFDTAQMYGNEAAVGTAIKRSGINISEFCITTKVKAANFSAKNFLPSVEQSLRKLQVQSVDLLLLHWPPADGNIVPSLELLLQAREEGLARYIGVSNYTIAMLRRAVSIAGPDLATNQVEFHPLLNQEKLLAVANELGIGLSAYCSVARGEVFKVDDLTEIGTAHGKTIGQIALRWILQKGVSPITMSTKPDNIKSNFNIVDFRLSDEEMARIDGVTHRNYRVVDKHIVPDAPEWD